VTEPLTPEEVARLTAWLAGDDNADLSGIFSDARAFPDVARAVRAVVRATPTPDTRLREALTSWHAADGESWRLVAMERDGGIAAAGIPEAMLDAIIRRATREETT